MSLLLDQGVSRLAFERLVNALSRLATFGLLLIARLQKPREFGSVWAH